MLYETSQNADMAHVLQLALAIFGVTFFSMYKAMPRKGVYAGKERNWWIGIILFFSLFVFNFFAGEKAWSISNNIGTDKKITGLLSLIIHPYVLVVINIIFFFYFLQIQKSIDEWIATKSKTFQDVYNFVKTAFQIIWAIYVFFYAVVPAMKKINFASAKYEKVNAD